ncbi:MAG: hypothetical protein NTV22_11490 [bacterium]|nr:hypothetical protein [bacterium]
MSGEFITATIISSIIAAANTAIAYFALVSIKSVIRIGEANLAVLNREAMSITINPTAASTIQAIFSIKQPGVDFHIESISVSKYKRQGDGCHIRDTVHAIPFSRTIVKGAQNYFDLPSQIDPRQGDIITFAGKLNGVPFSISAAL